MKHVIIAALMLLSHAIFAQVAGAPPSKESIFIASFEQDAEIVLYAWTDEDGDHLDLNFSVDTIFVLSGTDWTKHFSSISVFSTGTTFTLSRDYMQITERVLRFSQCRQAYCIETDNAFFTMSEGDNCLLGTFISKDGNLTFIMRGDDK